MGEVEDRLQPYVDFAVACMKSQLKLAGQDQVSYETFIEMVLAEIYVLPEYSE